MYSIIFSTILFFVFFVSFCLDCSNNKSTLIEELLIHDLISLNDANFN